MHRIILIPLLSIALGLSAQNVKKGFKLLEKAEYEKSAEVFGEVIGENEHNLAAIFGLAMIYADNKSPLFNLIDAWSYAVKLRQNVEKLSPEEIEIIGEYFSNTEVRPRSIPVKKKIQYALETIEANLIKYIREENNLDIVYAVLEKFPDFRYRDNVIHIRNQLEFRRYEKQNTLEAYLEFIRKFPDASQIEKAIRYRNKLAFEQARQANTVEALQGYLEKYPEAIEYNMAVKLLNAGAFQQARQENSIAAYEEFISAYPDALEVADAKQVLRQLLYEYAKKIQTIQAFNEFIRKYPEGQQYIDIFNLKSLDKGMKFVSSQAFPSNNVQWARSFGEEEANELNACMSIDSNDFYVVGGTVIRNDTGTSDAWVIKLGTDGKMMWNKFVGDTYHDEVNILDINNRNEIIGIGYTWLGQDSTSRESWIFKLGSDGQKLWSKKLGRFHVRCILTTGQGPIFLGGFAINDTSGSMHYAMMSLNEHGKRLWNRTYTGVGEIVGLSLSGDNRILFTGSRWRAKMDPRGYLLWESSFAGTDSIFSSVLLPRGEILYLGVRNRISNVLIKTGTDNKVIYEKEIKTTDIPSASASLIMSSPAQAIALMNFPDYQTLNWISPAQGVIQKTVRIPSGMTVTGLHTDLKGNLMLVAYSGEILLIKNSGITF